MIIPLQLGIGTRCLKSLALRGCASVPITDHSFSGEMERVESLSELSRYLKLRQPEMSVPDALHLVHTALRLKTSSDKSLRGRVPREVVRSLARVLLSELDSMSAEDLVSLILVAGDNQKSLDEFLLYRVARVCAPKLEMFSTKQLVQIAAVFSKQDLGDEELLRGIGKRVASDDKSALSDLVKTLRSLSKLGIREDALTTRVLDTARRTRKIWEKDAVTLLIAMAELDVQEHDVCNLLWNTISTAKQPISHDDEYFLLFAYLWNPFPSPIIQKIIDRATKDNRIRKRLQLVSDCNHYGVVPAIDIKGLPPPSLRPKLPYADRTRRLKGDFDDNAFSPGSISSGLHFEVINVLQSMGKDVLIEVPTSSFIIDAVLPP